MKIGTSKRLNKILFRDGGGGKRGVGEILLIQTFWVAKILETAIPEGGPGESDDPTIVHHHRLQLGYRWVT
jgi:hypothetical protein